MAAQDVADGAAGRRRFDAVLHLQDRVQFFRAPRAMEPAFGED
jgi:hypothetical protein